MTHRAFATAALVLLPAVFCGSGCGIAGGTSVLTVPPVTGQLPASGSSLALGTITAVPNAGQNVTVATYNWGRFGESDVAVLKSSLEKSLGTTAKDAREYSLHVIVSRYIQAFSNDSGAAAAVIDFAVRRGSTLVFSDRFHAARDFGKGGLKTLGMMKDDLNEKLLTRVVRDAQLVAAGQPARQKYEGTFNTLEEVMVILPAKVFGSTGGSLILVAIGGATPPSRDVPWRELLKAEPVDWSKAP